MDKQPVNTHLPARDYLWLLKKKTFSVIPIIFIHLFILAFLAGLVEACYVLGPRTDHKWMRPVSTKLSANISKVVIKLALACRPELGGLCANIKTLKWAQILGWAVWAVFKASCQSGRTHPDFWSMSVSKEIRYKATFFFFLI